MTTIDSAWVDRMRKDTLTLIKNVDAVRTYDDVQKLYSAIRTFAQRFHDVFFTAYLNRDLGLDEKLNRSDQDWIKKKLSKLGWDYYTKLKEIPASVAGKYISEEGVLYEFQRKAPAWKAGVQRVAQVFWKALREHIEWYEQVAKTPIDVPSASEDRVEMEGIPVIIKGFLPSQHQEFLDAFRAGLRTFKQKAQAVAPILLKKIVPIEANFSDCNLDNGGEYVPGRIIIYLCLGSNRITHTLAHEMGHHIWKTVLSGEAQKFWAETIKGDYGDIDLAELLRVWPEGQWAFDMNIPNDPILSLQVRTLMESNGFREANTKEDFQKLYDRGVRTLSVPKTPITGYAGKNPEEAFCEALGLLVGYGPRTVHDRIKMWFETTLPGAVRVATFRYGRIADRVAMQTTPDILNQLLKTKLSDFVKDKLKALAKSLEYGGIAPFPIDELPQYLEGRGVPEEDAAQVLTVKLRTPRKKDSTLSEAYMELSRVMGKSVTYEGALEHDKDAPGYILGWAKAFKALKPKARTLFDRLVKKVALRRPSGSEDASWEHGTLKLSVRPVTPGVGAGHITHELGHGLETGLDLNSAPWGSPPFISEYAESRPWSEDFAESVRVFIERPSELKRTAPEKYAELARVLG